MTRRPAQIQPVAAATACAACAAEEGFTRASEFAPGYHIAVMHLHHVGDFEEQGWTVRHDLYGNEGATDVFCPHIDLEQLP
jgi:hypothetical protein